MFNNNYSDMTNDELREQIKADIELVNNIPNSPENNHLKKEFKRVTKTLLSRLKTEEMLNKKLAKLKCELEKE